MENTMRELVIPALQALNLRYAENGEVICLDFRAAPVAYHLCIREVRQPALLWLHFTPAIWVEAGASAVMELLLALNQADWLVTCARDPDDGEVVFDVELPLYAGITPEMVAEYLMNATLKVSAMIPQVLKVQWGGLSVAEALASRADHSNQPEQPLSRAEQEALEIVQRLEVDHEDSGL